jgi:Zn-dependent membrane protease YugP
MKNFEILVIAFLILSMDFQVAIQTKNFVHFSKVKSKTSSKLGQKIVSKFPLPKDEFFFVVFSFESSNQEPLHQHTQTL